MYNGWVKQGPVVKWYYIAFALRRRESDSRQVHKIIDIRNKEKAQSLIFVNSYFGL